jgi:hypothetical protein
LNLFKHVIFSVWIFRINISNETHFVPNILRSAKICSVGVYSSLLSPQIMYNMRHQNACNSQYSASVSHTHTHTNITDDDDNNNNIIVPFSRRVCDLLFHCHWCRGILSRYNIVLYTFFNYYVSVSSKCIIIILLCPPVKYSNRDHNPEVSR